MCGSFEYGIYYLGFVSVFLGYVFDGVEFIVVIMCIHKYVDEYANGVESGVFV